MRILLISATLMLVAVMFMAAQADSHTGAGSGDTAVKALIDNRCTSCHGAGRIERAQFDREEWERTVDRMIGHGTSLSRAERDNIVEYLSR
ncbi:hypothetical protein [Desulfurispira natronophila]|uniref:DnaJ-class molecular chaperone n=1 Tax=Desulfurispira natronophila TaxID=682562 RepID=A0A7W8DHS1_9BACT|nr:hypothetical protein [Desulfurispira natronophila]MBB5022739.1 DnaJ-class molecular chaperone [Desulfurispira natronophila]